MHLDELRMPENGDSKIHLRLWDLQAGDLIAIEDEDGISHILIGAKNGGTRKAIISWPSGYREELNICKTAIIFNGAKFFAKFSKEKFEPSYFQDVKQIKLVSANQVDFTALGWKDVPTLVHPSLNEIPEIPEIPKINLSRCNPGDAVYVTDRRLFGFYKREFSVVIIKKITFFRTKVTANIIRRNGYGKLISNYGLLRFGNQSLSRGGDIWYSDNEFCHCLSGIAIDSLFYQPRAFELTQAS